MTQLLILSGSHSNARKIIRFSFKREWKRDPGFESRFEWCQLQVAPTFEPPTRFRRLGVVLFFKLNIGALSFYSFVIEVLSFVQKKRRKINVICDFWTTKRLVVNFLDFTLNTSFYMNLTCFLISTVFLGCEIWYKIFVIKNIFLNENNNFFAHRSFFNKWKELVSTV